MTASETPRTDPFDWIASPTFQANLVLWMTQAQNRSRVPAVFADCGYSVFAIEQKIPLSDRLRGKLREASLAFAQPVVPDFILKGRKGSYLLLECKASMFGPNSSVAKQARSLLAMVPAELADSLALQKAQAVSVDLVYLSRVDDGRDEVEGVLEVSSEMESKEIATVPVGFLGLSCEDDGIFIQGGTSGRLPQTLTVKVAKRLRAFDASDGTDPRMLYVIPWLPQTEPQKDRDEYHKEALAERVKATALAYVDQLRIPSDVTLSPKVIVASLIGKVIIDSWKNSAALKQFEAEVVAILHRQLASLDDPPPLKQPDGGWSFSIQSAKDREAVAVALMAPRGYVAPGDPLQMLLMGGSTTRSASEKK